MNQIINNQLFYIGLIVINALFCGSFITLIAELWFTKKFLKNEIKVFEDGIKIINSTNDKIADIEQEVSNVKMFVQSTNSMRSDFNGFAKR